MKILKNTIVLLTLLFMGSLSTFAQNQATVYEQLCQLNKYWEAHPMDIELLDKHQTFESDRALIALHLELVESHLRTNMPEGLSVSQKANRTLGLDILKDYWQTGVFPVNTRHAYTLPYFIDDFNTACAVGQIMREGTGALLAAKISKENNYAFIENMTDPAIAQWANTNGFTEMELRWIQPTYSPNVSLSHINTAPNCNTANGGIDITVISSTMTIEGYEWREGVDLTNPVLQTTEDFTDSESGFYTLSITGTGGWGGGYNQRFSLSDADGPAVFPTVTPQQCATGEADGMIELGMGDGFSSIKWYDFQNNMIAQDVTQITGLQGMYPGDVFMGTPPDYTHRVEVVDAGGCKTYREFYVEVANEGPYMSNWQTEVTNADCETTGSIDLGTIYSESYEVSWNDGITSEDRSNLSAGIYTVTITDDMGCDISNSYVVEDLCATPPDTTTTVFCEDLSGLDFGFCDAIIGIAMVDGQCITLSGCGTVASDGVDYADFFYEDITMCIDCGGVVCPPLAPPCNLPVEPLEFESDGSSVSFNAITNLDPACLDPMLAFAEEVSFIAFTTTPNNGTIGQAGNSILYTPSNGFSGADQMSYQVCYTYSDPAVDVCFPQDNGLICTEQFATFIVTNTGGGCIDQSQIDPGVFCTFIYDPVCGCDNMTYSNACVAEFGFGVTSWTPGECGTGPPPCDDAWLDDYMDDTENSITEYTYNGETVYLQTTCDPFIADAITTLFDCNGMAICYQGGFAGFNWEGCASFPTAGVEVGPITECPGPDCDYINPVTDLAFIDSMLIAFSILGSPNCGCYSSLSMVNYEGQVTFYLDSDCNALDDPDLMYDCEGNIICTANGLTPPPYCGTFSVIDTLWTCSGGINPDFESKITMELSLNILLEGASDENGNMNPALSENGLLTAHPYDGAPYNYAGNPLSGNIPTGAVDYILVQLKEDFGLPVLHEQVCFVLTDGSIVNEDGDLPAFLVNSDQTFQVWMRHHNHLDVVSAMEITPAPLVPYFFTDAVTAMGTQQLKEIGPGLFAMFAGDLNQDGTISVTDYDVWTSAPAVVNQYMSADANLDGVVQTTDYDKWFDNKAKIGFAQLMD